MAPVTIDILCKVVDNYGDIGVVYRLAKALGDAWESVAPGDDLDIRLHVDNLEAFHELCPQVDPAVDVQILRGWTVWRWNSRAEGLLSPPPRVVLECFASGRPECLEELLFDPATSAPRVILNVEHLTAESWADDFHLLPAATRSAFVKKWFFMPGFSNKTGGLIIDSGFREAYKKWRNLWEGNIGPQRHRSTKDEGIEGSKEKTGMRGPSRVGLAEARRELAERLGLELPTGLENAFWVPIFSYERNYSRVVADLAAWGTELDQGAPFALAAAGRSQNCFLAGWEAAGRPFPALALPFLPQEAWDELLLASDFLIVRGEESLTRATLSGRPFVWHAYLQEGGYQLVKVRALLEQLCPHFRPEDFALLEALWIAFNDRAAETTSAGGNEPLLPFLRRLPVLEPGFAAFAAQQAGHGDLAAHLVTFLRKIV